ncbi:hypothetical protein NARC_10246 [Candidatus Nitrosocosmicus arcticus]|uniref:Uncharacterized protein n=1 Tax=Candidatus Nitrosocosmicus arcticus TaxID=2035267 RepID=A0A557SZ18_9ARCH|nr:hypothetical protein NARC_10246 [Candidatus Nitrosocosmicus arcticus]
MYDFNESEIDLSKIKIISNVFKIKGYNISSKCLNLLFG